MRTNFFFITSNVSTCQLVNLLLERTLFSCYFVFHYPVYNQLVYLSTCLTCSLVHLLLERTLFSCYFVFHYPVYNQLVYLSTCLTCQLVHLQQKTVPRSAKTLARYVTNAVELLLRRFSSLTPQPGRSSVGGYIQGKQLEPSCR